MKILEGSPLRALASAVLNRAFLDVTGHIETQSSNRNHSRRGRLHQEAVDWLTKPGSLEDRTFYGYLAGVSEYEIRRAALRP